MMSRSPELDASVRLMLPVDMDAVWAIEQVAYPFPWTKSILEGCLTQNYCCWVLECDENIVGYAIINFILDEMHLLNIVIDPRVQSQGYGRVLLRHVIDYAKSKKGQQIYLEVRLSNQIAERLYRSMGFEKIGERKAYYPAEDGREDALVLALPLGGF